MKAIMNKKYYICIVYVLTFSICITSFGQRKKELDEVKYMRNSLNTMLVYDGQFLNKDKVLKAYDDYEFPDKYNDHRLDLNSMDLATAELSEQEWSAFLTEIGAESKEAYDAQILKYKETFDENYTDERLDIYKIKNLIIKNNMASEMVKKWFDSNQDGKLEFDLVRERGLYNASKEDIDNALSEARGSNSIIDGAVLDIVPKTYLVLNKMNFVSNEWAAALIREAAYEAAKELGPLLETSGRKVADKIYEKTKEGYSVWTRAYLFQLKWDEEMKNKLYDYWGDEGVIKDDFKDIGFTLDHIGTERATSLVTFSLKKEDKERTEDDIINLATVRNVEKVFSKLTKNYEAFKPKVPLAEFKPFTAFIGMKEGLKGGETFEVLNEQYDQKTGRTIYKKIGTLKVDKKSVWDNRYSLDGEDTNESPIDRTLFKGKAGNATFGSLLRLIK